MDVMGIIELSKVSIPGCFWPFRFAGVLIVSKIAGFLVHSRSRREPIPSQLQFPLLRKNRPPAWALHIGKKVNPIRFYGIRDGIITRSWCLLLYITSWFTLIKPATAIEGFLILGRMLRVVEIFAAAQHINGLVLTRSGKVLQSLVLFIIGDEICISSGLQFLG